MNNAPLTSAQVAEFEANGILIVRQFYDLDWIADIQKGIHDIIGQMMVQHDIADTRNLFSGDRFDEGYQELLEKNRMHGGKIYDAIKQIPAFLRLLSHPAHSLIMKQLRPDSVPGIAAGGYGIRIDNPFEDKYRAMWHQEYPAQLRSLDGLVFWSPLVNVTKELGPVRFCIGSHREGPLPVTASDPDKSGRSGAYALKLNNEEDILARYQQGAPLTSPGDLVIIDFQTIHASGFNRGKRSRWSMQFRYFNFAEPVGRAHGWSGSYAAGVNFRTIHPELFIEPEIDQ